LLDGELKLASSVLEQGSVFVFYVPHNSGSPAATADSGQTPRAVTGAVASGIADRSLGAMRELETRDNRDVIQPGDRILLIVEDDPGFAKILLDLAREKGFRGIVARRGALALELAHSHKPDAITLDIHIPDMDGWTVLDVLKSDPGLRHIPVDVISVEDNSLRGLSHGAFQFLCKPVSRSQLDTAMETTLKFLDRPVKNLLLVISGKDELKEITALLGNGDIAVQSAASGKAGLAAMRKKSYDCVVAGAALADMSGATFIATLREE
jgi:CheY-like chemotaxis protein